MMIPEPEPITRAQANAVRPKYPGDLYKDRDDKKYYIWDGKEWVDSNSKKKYFIGV